MSEFWFSHVRCFCVNKMYNQLSKIKVQRLHFIVTIFIHFIVAIFTHWESIQNVHLSLSSADFRTNHAEIFPISL